MFLKWAPSDVEIENGRISSVEMGSRHTDGRAFALTYQIAGETWSQAFSVGIDLEGLRELCMALGGELVKDVIGKPVRIARRNKLGRIVGIGDIIENRWFMVD